MEQKPAPSCHSANHKNGLHLLTTPYGIVANVFSADEPRDCTVTGRDSGGYLAGKPSKDAIRSHHVESNFSATQRSYIAVTMGALHKLLYGRVHGSSEQLPTLCERIVTVINGKNVSSFGAAVASGLQGCISEFGNCYPNLIPALYTFTNAAGITGLSIAVNDSRYQFLRARVQMQSNPDELPELGSGLTDQDFIGSHEFSIGVPMYEIQCSGKALAFAIMEESGVAAISLMKSLDRTYADELAAREHYDTVATFRTDLKVQLAHMAVEAATIYAQPTL
jgi:hypothetical protein